MIKKNFLKFFRGQLKMLKIRFGFLSAYHRMPYGKFEFIVFFIFFLKNGFLFP